MTEWLAAQARKNPARMVLAGFVPVLLYLCWQTYEAWRESTLAGVLVGLTTLGCLCAIVGIACAVDLMRKLDEDRRKRDDEG